MTKEEARGVIQQLIDDPSGARWHPTRLDLLCQLTIDSLWVEIMRAAPSLYVETEDVTLTSPGYFTSSDLTERLYRIKKVTYNGREYGPIDDKLIVLEGDDLIVGYDRTWTQYGSKIHLFPYDTSYDAEISYSYRGTRFTDLGDEETVLWPDGHELVFILETSAAALHKGAAEDPTGILQQAEKARRRMVAELERLHDGPVTVQVTESPISYGSE